MVVVDLDLDLDVVFVGILCLLVYRVCLYILFVCMLCLLGEVNSYVVFA